MEQKPQIQENPKKELLKDLRRLKIEYRNGIPEEIKHSTSEDSGWKVQRGWFQDIASLFDDILFRQENGEILISKEFYSELFKYNDNLVDDNNPLKHRLTLQADIDEAEAMIDKVISELEKNN